MTTTAAAAAAAAANTDTTTATTNTTTADAGAGAGATTTPPDHGAPHTARDALVQLPPMLPRSSIRRQRLAELYARALKLGCRKVRLVDKRQDT